MFADEKSRLVLSLVLKQLLCVCEREEIPDSLQGKEGEQKVDLV